MTLRAFQLPADLTILEEILPLTFHYPENEDWSVGEEEMENARDSVKMLHRIWPLFSVARLLSPPLRDAMLGFLWEEDGQVAGLTNVARIGTSTRWVIGNVSVLPEFRRRGIARKLVEACIELARSKGAKQIELDVIDGNVPAYNLYLSLGFEHFASKQEMICEAPQAVEEPPLPAGYTPEKTKPLNWQPRYQLTKRITPPEIQKYSPVSEKTYRPPAVLRPLVPLINALSGEKDEVVLVHAAGEEGIVAYTRYSARRKQGGQNSLFVRVDPAHAVLAEPLLLLALARTVAIGPGRPVTLEVPNWQPSVEEAAQKAGFVTRRPFHTLGLLL